MLIKSGFVLNDEFQFVKADLSYTGKTIDAIGQLEGEGIDAEGCYVVPGFVDTHFHGAFGTAFLNHGFEDYDMIAAFEARNGTTTIVPTISANPTEKMLASIQTALDYVAAGQKDNCAEIVGLHLEGPFFDETFKGAHKTENIRNPDVEEFKKFVALAGNVLKIMTMAPELPGGDEVIKCAVENGVCISIGHTGATYEQTLHAIELGAQQGTHLFNGMRGITHREPGTAGGILFSNAKAELICDFFHVHKDVVKMVYDLKGCHKINMITDSTRGNGLPDGEHFLDGGITIRRNGQSYTQDGRISGGSTCMIDTVRNMVSIGIPLEEVCIMACKNPAETVGVYGRVGSLAPGKQADILILDKDLNIKKIIMRGKDL